MIKKLKKIIGNKKGETIAETIIAVSILAIGITLSSTLMSTSLKNIAVSKSRVIAVNIAREGIEAVRNIRDTNWLKFSGRRRSCWNHMPGDAADEICDGTNPIEPDDYIVYKNIDGRWRLADLETDVDSDTVDTTPLYTIDIDTETDTDRDGYADNDADMYNHIYVDGDDALGDAPQPTLFSRTITISYLANDGTELSAPSSVTDEYNRMFVISTVTWEEQGVARSVELKTHLTDYLGRDNLDS